MVYLAEQIEPVRRKVALKVIKRGMDTDQVVARFEAERQALAQLFEDDQLGATRGPAHESGGRVGTGTRRPARGCAARAAGCRDPAACRHSP